MTTTFLGSPQQLLGEVVITSHCSRILWMFIQDVLRMGLEVFTGFWFQKCAKYQHLFLEDH